MAPPSVVAEFSLKLQLSNVTVALPVVPPSLLPSIASPPPQLAVFWLNVQLLTVRIAEPLTGVPKESVPPSPSTLIAPPSLPAEFRVNVQLVMLPVAVPAEPSN